MAGFEVFHKGSNHGGNSHIPDEDHFRLRKALSRIEDKYHCSYNVSYHMRSNIHILTERMLGTSEEAAPLTMTQPLMSAIGADPVDTGRASGSETNWLEDDLLEKLPIAHIYFYDHGRDLQTDGLDELAKRLLNCHIQKRGPTSRRSMFLCHSTGGLVVKQALVVAAEDHTLDHCIGVAFFDPQFLRTAIKAQHPKYPFVYNNPRAKSYGVHLYKGPVSPQLSMQLIPENSFLLNLSDSFARMVKGKSSIHIWSVYEGIPTSLRWKGEDASEEGTFVVSSDSATYGLNERGVNILLPCDHCGVASFDIMRQREYPGVYVRRRSISQKLDFIQELQSRVFQALWPADIIMDTLIIQNHQLFKDPDGSLYKLDPKTISIAKLLGGDLDDFLDIEEPTPGSSPLELPVGPINSTKHAQPLSPALRRSQGTRKNEVIRSEKQHTSSEPSRLPEDQINRVSSGHQSSQSGSRKGVQFLPDIGIFKSKSSPQSQENLTQEPGREKTTRQAGLSSKHYSVTFTEPSEQSLSPIIQDSPYQCQWVHIPCNHIGWIEKILHVIATEKGQETELKEMLQEKYWEKKQNSITHHFPHTHYMHSTCEFLGADINESKITPELRELLSNKGVKVLSNLAEYLEIGGKSGKRDTFTDNREDHHAVSRQVLYLHLGRVEDNLSAFIDPTSSAGRKGEGGLLAKFELFSKLKANLDASAECQLIWHHLCGEKPLHCRRSLDQYMYSTLQDTSTRDRDQILYKAGKLDSRSRNRLDYIHSPDPDILQSEIRNKDSFVSKRDISTVRSISHRELEDAYDPENFHWTDDESDDEEGHPGNILVVDQLWLFVMNDITCFPPKEIENKSGGMQSSATQPTLSSSASQKLKSQGDLQTCILKDLEIDAELIQNQWEVVAFIVKYVVTLLFDKFNDKEPRVLTNFGRYIEMLTERQVKSWARLDFRRGSALGGSNKEVQQIFKDLQRLREVRDVEDELKMIKKVLDRQHMHVGTMQRGFREVLDLSESKGSGYLSEALNTIQRVQEQVGRMLENVQEVIRGYEELIGYQLNKISVNEAIDAGEQSRSVTIFTS
ncbi:hypothetical protein F5884DRAFT_757935 [Xylogone sp. PMI_703]|nr:hypothetical protein F5884DRAFT_757935 [Xylogone sp. PMI_703]